MGKVLLCLAAIILACYSSDGAEIGGKATRNLGTFNTYHVYSRDYPYEPKEIFPTLSSANLHARDFRSKVVILIHDHEGSHNSLFDASVRYALLASEDVTVIVVDWSLVAGLAYTNAVSNVPNVGANIAELIRVLLQYRRVTLANLHIVGFGLGAQVAAFAARSVNGVVARITGLDPSPLAGNLLREYLRSGDAGYVEVIHTDGRNAATGHIEFFPNGGVTQPGCTTGSDENAVVDNACNHNRAYILFAASLGVDGASLIGRFCPATVVDMSTTTCTGPGLLLGNNQMIKYGLPGSYFLESDIQYRSGKFHLFEPMAADETM